MEKFKRVNLIRASFSNHYSFKDEQNVFFERETKYPLNNNWKIIERNNKEILPVTVFYGANASGKTNLMRIFNKFKTFFNKMDYVFYDIDGFTPFLLNESKRDEDSFLELELSINEDIFIYSITFDKLNVKKESLYLNDEKLYVRTNRRIAIQDKKISELVKRNIKDKLKRRFGDLVIEYLAIEGYEPYVSLYKVFNRSFAKFDSVESNNEVLAMLYNNKELTKYISKWLKSADIGISYFSIDRVERTEDMRKFQKELYERFNKARGLIDSQKSFEILQDYKYDYYLKFYHVGENGKEYPLELESKGTKEFLNILVKLLPAFKEGGLFFVDEIENSLHPLLVKIIIQSFNNPKINQAGAQLICTTHNSSLLKKDILRRDEGWFVEKDIEGYSAIYPLSQFNDIRNNVDYEKGYLNGKFGAIPILGTILDFEDIVEK